MSATARYLHQFDASQVGQVALAVFVAAEHVHAPVLLQQARVQSAARHLHHCHVFTVFWQHTLAVVVQTEHRYFAVFIQYCGVLPSA